MMLYQAMDGQRFDIGSLPEEQGRLFDWSLTEFVECVSWMEFQERTGHGIIEGAKKYARGGWKNHPLFQIQLDMVGRVGVLRKGVLQKELCDMLITPESMRGQFWKNGDIDLSLTVPQWRLLDVPYRVNIRGEKAEEEPRFYQSLECVLEVPDVPDGLPSKKATLRIDPFLVAPDGMRVMPLRDTYMVSVTVPIAERILREGEYGSRYGSGMGSKVTVRMSE